jgi:Zinc finger, C3HC4 type (RING finger)
MCQNTTDVLKLITIGEFDSEPFSTFIETVRRFYHDDSKCLSIALAYIDRFSKTMIQQLSFVEVSEMINVCSYDCHKFEILRALVKHAATGLEFTHNALFLSVKDKASATELISSIRWKPPFIITGANGIKGIDPIMVITGNNCIKGTVGPMGTTGAAGINSCLPLKQQSICQYNGIRLGPGTWVIDGMKVIVGEDASMQVSNDDADASITIPIVAQKSKDPDPPSIEQNKALEKKDVKDLKQDLKQQNFKQKDEEQELKLLMLMSQLDAANGKIALLQKGDVVDPKKQKAIIVNPLKVKKCLPTEVEKDQCIICLTNRKNVVSNPCGHIVICLECLEQQSPTITNCPVCRSKVIEWIVVFS